MTILNPYWGGVKPPTNPNRELALCRKADTGEGN